MIFILPGTPLLAQGWEHTINLGQSQAATNVVPSGGGYIVYGFFGPISNYGENDVFVLKIDESGKVLWSHIINSPHLLYPTDMIATAAGDVAMCGYTFDNSGNHQAFVARYTTAGDSLWLKYYGPGGADFQPTSLVETSTGNFMLAINYITTDSTADTTYAPVIMLLDSSGDSLSTNFIFGHLETQYRLFSLVNTKDHNVMAAGAYLNIEKPYFLKLNELGDTLWSSSIPYTGSDPSFIPFDVIQTQDSGYVMSGLNVSGPLHPHTFLVKIDKDGNLLWSNIIYDSTYYTYSFSLLENSSGELILAANMQSANGVQPALYFPQINLLDNNGNVLKSKIFPGSIPNIQRYVQSIAYAQNGGYIFAGGSGNDIYLVSTDSIGNIYPAHISGNVFYDANRNCTLDAGELGLANWIIQASNVLDTSFTVSDSNGNYTIDCDTGDFVLAAQPASNYWSDTLCANNLLVTVPPTADTVFNNIPIAALVSCPVMQVQVSAAYLRRCSTHTLPYTISYTNAGTQTATNVYVDVTLDTFLILNNSSSNVTYNSLGNNSYRFFVGTVGINASGSFNFYVFTSCNQPEPGMTHCVEAHIYPDSAATTANPLWDGSDLVLKSACEPEKLAFMINNTGGNMQTPTAYAIIQDDVLYAAGHIQLNAGQLDTLLVPANGSTWTLIASEAAGFPGNDMPLISVEGCGVGSSGLFDTGYVPMFPQNNQSGAINTLCLQDVGSYDPNAKAPAPLGIGTTGLIDASQQLTYTISFQNTGTDTAFLVSVVDSLSPLLDISTIQVAKSSNPYTWNIVPNHVLQFVFSGINLPDSTVNEPASHGLISFTIYPIKALAAGTQIHNTSYIYFDQNPPVQTNVTLNTIGTLFSTWLSITEISDEAHLVKCYPNPNAGQLMVDYKGINADASFSIYDIMGDQVFSQQVVPGLQQLNINSLNPGIYIYQLTVSGLSASGKIVKF